MRFGMVDCAADGRSSRLHTHMFVTSSASGRCRSARPWRRPVRRCGGCPGRRRGRCGSSAGSGGTARGRPGCGSRRSPGRRGNSGRPPGVWAPGRWTCRAVSTRSGRSPQRRRQLAPHRRLEEPLVAEHAALLRLAGGEEDRPLAGHLPAELAGQEIAASAAQLAAAPGRRLRASRPPRTSSDHSVSRWYSSRCSSGLPGNRCRLLSANSFGQRQVDRPDRAVEIDRAEQLGPHAR